MIIWINGAFGVGKSHTSAELVRRLDNTFLFDPETVGFFLRKHLPNMNQFDDFQKSPLWRKQVLDNLLYCDQQNVITVVPMTIVDDEIFDFIIDGLKKNGINVLHFSLIANKHIIEKRLIRRGDINTWNFKQIDRCLASLFKEKHNIQIDTENNSLDEVVELIAKYCSLDLKRKRQNWFFKKLNWLKITIKNIR
jgi:hypothetical protein